MVEALLEFYKAVLEEREPEKLLRLFLRAMLAVQGVERGSLWVRRGDHCLCVEALGPQSETIRGLSLPLDVPSVVGWVLEHGEMTIAEPGKDSRHHAAVEEKVDRKSTLILCLPLILRDGSVYGAVQIIDTSAAGDKLNLDPAFLRLLQAQVTVGAIALSNSLEFMLQQQENLALQHALKGLRSSGSIIGHSAALQETLRLARDYARTDFPVCITGESGTGKELFAHEIHRLSQRRDQPFLVQNCSAIPETLLESELFGYKKGAFTGANQDKTGLFAAADGGTVFLDEIGDMPLALQARILRVLQNGEVKALGSTRSVTVDVRILSATNRDLPRAIAAGQFREDLYYRLNVLPLHLPPLRERNEDIPLLLRYFLAQEARSMGTPLRSFSPAALKRLSRHPWRGNVREMENFVKYLLTTSEAQVIDVEDLPAQLLEPPTPPMGEEAPEEGRLTARGGASTAPPFGDLSWEELERRYVLDLMERTRWNISKAASLAGVNRSTFDSRMRKLGIRKS